MARCQAGRQEFDTRHLQLAGCQAKAMKFFCMIKCHALCTELLRAPR